MNMPSPIRTVFFRIQIAIIAAIVAIFTGCQKTESTKAGVVLTCTARGNECLAMYSFTKSSVVTKEEEAELTLYFDRDDCFNGALMGQSDHSNMMYPIGRKPWSELINYPKPDPRAKSAKFLPLLSQEIEGIGFWFRSRSDRFAVVRINSVKSSNYKDLLSGKSAEITFDWCWATEQTATQDKTPNDIGSPDMTLGSFIKSIQSGDIDGMRRLMPERVGLNALGIRRNSFMLSDEEKKEFGVVSQISSEDKLIVKDIPRISKIFKNNMQNISWEIHARHGYPEGWMKADEFNIEWQKEVASFTSENTRIKKRGGDSEYNFVAAVGIKIATSSSKGMQPLRGDFILVSQDGNKWLVCRVPNKLLEYALRDMPGEVRHPYHVK